jgi:SpoVK/Ycf46/Vps4 family AAA+-type ATPase
MNIDTLFDRRIDLPDMDVMDRYQRLVGLDETKSRLEKILGILINPSAVAEWQEKFHPSAENLLETILRRPPLIVLAGDVGTGKTELGETVGDAVARKFDIGVRVYPLSLSTRGSGRVGEMTQLISEAFTEVHNAATELKRVGDAAKGGLILLIDEADAIAQSRESSQMHHEDRAGVNALLRGIDRLAENGLPVAVIMCTNRWSALDPAIQRRACEVVKFDRPNAAQRRLAIETTLSGTSLRKQDIDTLVDLTGPEDGQDYGYTYSDITQRLLPSVALAAFPDSPITADLALSIARSITPTPRYGETTNDQ